MSPAAVAAIADLLVGEEMVAKGLNKPEARINVAHDAGVAPGSLEGLARGRLKYVDRLAGRLNALRVRKLEQKILEAQHELKLVKAMGVLTPHDFARAESSIAEARRALGREG